MWTSCWPFADFAALNARGLTAKLELVHGNSGASRRAADRARGLIGVYGAEQASLRLIARGVAPAVMTPVSVEAVDVSAPPRSHSGFLMFVPILLLWLALSAGGAMALDSTVGERERGSLEPLLLNPVARPAVVIGKWLASSVFACGSVIAAVLATLLVLHWVPWHDYGVQMRVRDGDVLLAGVVMLPLAMLMSAVLMLVSAVARSLQQAHTYLAVVAMTTVLFAMASFLFELSDVAWIAPIPISGQLARADLLAGSSPEPLRYVLSVFGSALVAVVLIVVTTALLRRESIVFRS
jgi:sodium transport system permease protein